MRGNPGRRPLNMQEPEFPAAEVICPPELKGRAADEWNRVAPGLHAAGLLTVGGRTAFIIACHLAAEIDRYERLIARTAMRDPMRLPWEAHLNHLRTQYRQYCAEFGQTPARASSVKAAKAPEAGDEKRRRFFGVSRGATAS
jgi:phage terminase small subunit